MTLTVDYLAFAIGGSPNVIDQADYLASQSGSGIVADGFQTGIAQSNYFNKAFRQSSMVAAAVANMISTQLGINVLDDGNLSNLVANLTAAIQQIGALGIPRRLVTSSANANFLTSDYYVGLNRTVAPAATTYTVPNGPPTDKIYAIEDLSANADQFNITIALPAGHTFAGGAATYKLVAAKQWAEIGYYGSSIWGLKSGTP